MQKIQVIDFQSPTASRDFATGLRESGFAVIANHPVALDTINQAYAEWFEFFNSKEKFDFLFDHEKQEGFVPLELSETAKGHTIKDLKEFYHYYPWGRCPKHLLPVTKQLFNDLNALASTLLGWIEDNLPSDIAKKLSEPLSHMIENSDKTLFRLLYYPPITGDEDPSAIRAAAHEDINLITALPSATTAGLQVLAKDGSWLDVPREEGWVVINAGDMLQECTEGYYPSTTHRVVNPEGAATKEARLSMPLFLHPRSEVKLSERFTAGSYLTTRLKELGLM